MEGEQSSLTSKLVIVKKSDGEWSRIPERHSSCSKAKSAGKQPGHVPIKVRVRDPQLVQIVITVLKLEISFVKLTACTGGWIEPLTSLWELIKTFWSCYLFKSQRNPLSPRKCGTSTNKTYCVSFWFSRLPCHPVTLNRTLITAQVYCLCPRNGNCSFSPAEGSFIWRPTMPCSCSSVECHPGPLGHGGQSSAMCLPVLSKKCWCSAWNIQATNHFSLQ